MKQNLQEEYNYIYHMLREVTEVNGLRLKPQHKTVLFCLESRGRSIFPSHELLAENCGIGETKLKTTLKELREHNILDWIQTKGFSNRYRINRQAIANSYASLTEQRALIDLSESEKLESFRQEWEIAGVGK